MSASSGRSMGILGGLLAVGLMLGAYILGAQTRHIGSAKQSITVKGLAEQPVKATRAAWNITVNSHAATQQEALSLLRRDRAALDKFLAEYGFNDADNGKTAESIEPNMVYENYGNGRGGNVQRGYNGQQTLTVKTDDLAKVQEARAKIVEFKADGHNVGNNSLEFLVGNLDEIKLSLIGTATKNAKARAQEFAKNGDVKVGLMRAASQGTFDILSADGNNEEDTYGGNFDTSSINKIARVVVTIEYEIEK